jgi:NTE family protein
MEVPQPGKMHQEAVEPASSPQNESSFFDGLTPEERGQIRDLLEQRRFRAGVTMLAEGDSLHEMYIIQSGSADVFTFDQHGNEYRIARVGPGATLGEMSLFTGQPASSSVRAATDLDVLVLSEHNFRRAASAFPRIYHNLGAILSARLARSNRRSIRPGAEHVTALRNFGAPPLLSYALACSVAWHTRASTLLLMIGDAVPDELAALVAATVEPELPLPSGTRSSAPLVFDVEPRAHLMFAAGEGAFAPRALTRTVEDLAERYDRILVQLPGEWTAPSFAARTLCLAGPHNPVPGGGDDRRGYTIRAWTNTSVIARPNADRVLRVPALTPADERELRTGVLPADSAAGRALGWAARDVAGLKVGLALGGGGVKGYAHIGVLRALDHIGLTVDYLAGSSIGAAVAAVYASGHRPDTIADLMDKVTEKAFRVTLPTRSLLSNAGLRAGLIQIGGQTHFEDLPIPLAVVTADIVSGEEIVFHSGLLWPAVLASFAIPGMYPPQRMGARLLVDGGVLNPVPGDVAADMGADVVIAVKLASRSNQTQPDAKSTTEMPSILETINRTREIMQSKIGVASTAAATVLIEPDFGKYVGWGLRNFREGRKYVAVGEAATVAALPRIAAALPWLRS